MSTYREIHGKAIKSVTTDPSAATDEGQVWYNTNSSTFKSIISTEAWSSASALNTAVYYNCGAGDQTKNGRTGLRLVRDRQLLPEPQPLHDVV